jgi:carbonic anhydrase/acetyltransferase-like protein (isoleucine patch superfamily)
MEFHPVFDRLGRFLDAQPEIAPGVYVAPNATIVGKVSIGSGSSVVTGSPGKVVRQLLPAELKGIEETRRKI